MSTSSQSDGFRRLLDYVSLTKPRINALVLVTTFIGAWMAAGQSGLIENYIVILVGTGLTVAGASVFNCYQERDVDARMERTQDRPLPAERLDPDQALMLGVMCSFLGLSLLAILTNWLSCFLAFIALVTYAPLYTWMKGFTSLSTVVGAVPGALPPVIGWAGMTNSVEYPAVFLFLIMFVWQPPHFLALALFKQEDYDRANLSMLPVEMNDAAAVRQIVIYTSALIPLSLLPSMSGLGGRFYLLTALVGGIIFLAGGLLGLKKRFRKNTYWAKALFFYSIAYLTVLFVSLLMDSGGVS
ncbi:MAG: heme o synthase [bacterium]